MSNLRTTGSSGGPSGSLSSARSVGGVRGPRRSPSLQNAQQAEAERLRRSAQATAQSLEAVEARGEVAEGAVFDPPPVEEALATFLAPPAGGLRVVDPAATIALTDAAGELAASGDPVDRYAAVVVETHLAARRELSRQINALLKA